MKIDVIASISLRSAIGPAQTLKRIINSKDWFKENNVEMNVFTSDNITQTKEDQFKSKDSLGLKIARVVARELQRHTKFYPRNRIRMYHVKARNLLNYYQSLNREPDIIIFHGVTDCYEYLTGYRKKGVKVILFIHSDGSPEGNKMQLSYFPKLRGTKDEEQLDREIAMCVDNIDGFACITKIEMANMMEQFPSLKGRIFSVVNGISDLTEEQLEDTACIRHQKQKKEYRMVSVGSISGRKGHREIIESIHNMRPDLREKLHVMFLGGGSDKIKMQALVNKYELNNQIEFVGVVPNDEVYKYQAQSNICILFSKLEGLPLGLIEGLRSGLALISTNVSGIPELIDDEINGKLIEFNEKDLLEVFNNLDKYDWDTMGRESRKRFEDYYNFPRMRNDYLAMAKTVMNKKL